MIRTFIGYDRRIPVAFQVAAHSILTHASRPVTICPVMLTQLAGIYTRAHDNLQSTEFTYSRFLVPYLSGYEGWSLFMDNDVIVVDDIADLWALRDERFAVMCVQNRQVVREQHKFLNHTQTQYEKKNWSSVMLFNNAKCTALTPQYVNTASGLELHQFKWLGDDALIGSLPPEWNHLVDETQPVLKSPSLIHYTKGGPFYQDYINSAFSREWYQEFAAANRSDMSCQELASVLNKSRKTTLPEYAI